MVCFGGLNLLSLTFFAIIPLIEGVDYNKLAIWGKLTFNCDLNVLFLRTSDTVL